MITRPPQPDEILAELPPAFLRIVWEALEGGSEHARAYAEKLRSQRYKLEPPLASMMVRSFAKEYIADKSALEVAEFEPRNVANVGLRLRIGRFDIIIWKSPDNRIPFRCSGPKRRFLSQEIGIQLGLNWPEGEMPTNLVILWNADHLYRITYLHLALPMSPPDMLFEPADAYWSVAIDHPATTVERTESPTTADEPTLEYEPLDDEDHEREVEDRR